MPQTDTRRSLPRRGVSLSGAEFGTNSRFCNEEPGQFGKEYTYNSERTVAYFAQHGVPLLRIPFLWNASSPALGNPSTRRNLIVSSK